MVLHETEVPCYLFDVIFQSFGGFLIFEIFFVFQTVTAKYLMKYLTTVSNTVQ